MADIGRVITAKLPGRLAARVDEASARIDRSKSWIVRQAITEWLAEDQLRCELANVIEGSSI